MKCFAEKIANGPLERKVLTGETGWYYEEERAKRHFIGSLRTDQICKSARPLAMVERCAPPYRTTHTAAVSLPYLPRLFAFVCFKLRGSHTALQTENTRNVYSYQAQLFFRREAMDDPYPGRSRPASRCAVPTSTCTLHRTYFWNYLYTGCKALFHSLPIDSSPIER